jgi:hypothetical protein
MTNNSAFNFSISIFVARISFFVLNSSITAVLMPSTTVWASCSPNFILSVLNKVISEILILGVLTKLGILFKCLGVEAFRGLGEKMLS